MSRLLYRIARILLKHSPDKHYIDQILYEQEQRTREFIHQEIQDFYEKLAEEHIKGVPITVAKNHILMHHALAGSEQRLWELLLKIEKYRLRDSFVDMSHYAFDLDSFYKEDIYALWREILLCLRMKKKGLAKYLKEYTNIAEDDSIRTVCNSL